MRKSGGIRNHHRLSEHSTAFGASDIEDIAELSQIRKLNVIKSTGGRRKEKARFDRYRNRKRDKKLNQTLILSKTLPIIIKTDSSRDLDSQTMESLPSRNVTHFPALHFKTKHFPLVKTRALRNIGLDLFRSIEYLRE